MVFGFPGFFILSSCPSGCQAALNTCPVCDGVGKALCIVHSEAPYIVPHNENGLVAVHRDTNYPYASIRTICGDVIVYLDSKYRI